MQALLPSSLDRICHNKRIRKGTPSRRRSSKRPHHCTHKLSRAHLIPVMLVMLRQTDPRSREASRSSTMACSNSTHRMVSGAGRFLSHSLPRHLTCSCAVICRLSSSPAELAEEIFRRADTMMQQFSRARTLLRPSHSRSLRPPRPHHLFSSSQSRGIARHLTKPARRMPALTRTYNSSPNSTHLP